ncbi:MAG: DUF1207 domain-containing protein [Pirellulales bacterium]
MNGPSPVPATPRLAAAGPPYQLLDPHVSVSPSGFAPGPYTNAPPLSPEPSAFNPLLNEFRAPPPQMVRHQPGGGPWTWQLLPDGLMYRSYLAGVREPRFGGVWNYERDIGWIWDIALGGRAGIIRYGTNDPFHPEGWQLDIEGAGFPRLDLEDENDLVSVDFRFGVPLTYRVGRFQSKFGFYHLSSHLGDEFLETHPDLTRINYSRDVLVLGVGWFFTPSLRGYAEAGYAFHSDVGLEWEFQFGFDYSPAYPTGPRAHPSSQSTPICARRSTLAANLSHKSVGNGARRSRPPFPHRCSILQRHERTVRVHHRQREQNRHGHLVRLLARHHHRPRNHPHPSPKRQRGTQPPKPQRPSAHLLADASG